jgi:phospholipid/cholesterol/gamma-HCH transport system ATP-binding protein
MSRDVPAEAMTTNDEAARLRDGAGRGGSDETAIRLVDVHKSFGEKKVLCGMDLEVRRGETFVILGPSGTGKSCTLKLLVGLMRPDRGEVWVDRQRVDDSRTRELWEVRSRIGYLFQSSALINWLSVAENVALPLSEHTNLPPHEIDRQVDRHLAQVHMLPSKHQMPGELSGGQKRRVALARVLSGNPSIILYDEPTAGLDPIMTQNIASLIRSVQREFGVTSILVTHDLPCAWEAGDRVAFVDGGRVVHCDSTGRFRDTDHPAVRHFLDGGRAASNGGRR